MIYPATEESIARAAGLLASGELVGLPTETVYGLAANAWDAAAVRRIFAAKSRPAQNPLIVHVAGVDRLADAIHWPPTPVVQKQLAAIIDLWPGPLTVVCERSARIPDEVTAGRATVAVRVPAHGIALRLLAACRFPLAAPSANRSKYISPTHPEHLVGPAGIADHIAMVLDGGPCRWGVESTIVKLGDPIPTLLRPGAVSIEELARRFQVDPESMRMPMPTDDSQWLAPGMMREHYSPVTPLILLADGHRPSTATPATRIGRIAFQPLADQESNGYEVIEVLSSNGNLEDVAREIFAALRRLDAVGLDEIHCDICRPIGLGLAIMDRLHRAAARTRG